MFRLLIVFVCILLMTGQARSQVQDSFEISGHLEGLKEGQRIVLSECLFGNFIFGRKDTAYVKNRRFRFSGSATNGPLVYLMEFGHEANNKICRLAVENGDHIKISCDSNISKINHTVIESFLKIEGSPSTNSWFALKSGQQMYNQMIFMLRSDLRKIQDSVGFDPHLIAWVINRKKRVSDAYWGIFFSSFYDDILYRPAIPFYIIGNKVDQLADHPSWIMDIYKSLDEKTKNSYWGKYLHDYAKLSVGQPFPDFNLTTHQGKPLLFKDFASKGKLTVVQFWAENSFDRAKYQEELKMLYKKYHDKGLNVIGFSSDKYPEQWRQAIEKFQLPWHQVCEFKGREGIVEKVYHEFSTDEDNNYMIHNTTNVLIDSEGKIVAWDPTGVELQYYLWKYLGD